MNALRSVVCRLYNVARRSCDVSPSRAPLRRLRAYIDEAIRIAEHVDHTISWLHAYHESGYLALCHGDLVKAIPLLERGWALCQMRQAHAFNTRFRSTLGAVYTLSGRGAEALLLLEQAAEESVTTGLLAYYAHSLIHLSGAYLCTGRL